VTTRTSPSTSSSTRPSSTGRAAGATAGLGEYRVDAGRRLSAEQEYGVRHLAAK